MNTPARRLVVRETAELRDILGEVVPPARDKVRSKLEPYDLEWLARSPFCLVATSGADGSCDVSPKGDPPGFVHVLDHRTIAIPERPGNRRADGFHNLIENPQVGLLFIVPGRTDTLRINGHAHLLREAPYFDALVVNGHRPQLVLEVEVDEVFRHCSKAFMRSDLWEPQTWNPGALPSPAQLSKTFERKDQSLEELERYYGEEYRKKLY